MYIEKCKDYAKVAVKEHTYRHIFNYEYNIAFFQPKKDQCDYCAQYNNTTGSDKLAMKVKYDHHIQNKEAVRTLKMIRKMHNHRKHSLQHVLIWKQFWNVPMLKYLSSTINANYMFIT